MCVVIINFIVLGLFLINFVKLIVNWIRWFLFNEFIGLLIKIYLSLLNLLVVCLLGFDIFNFVIICLINVWKIF